MGFYKRMSDKQSEIKRYNAARRKADKLSSTPTSRLIRMETISEIERYNIAQDADRLTAFNKEVEQWQDAVSKQLPHHLANRMKVTGRLTIGSIRSSKTVFRNLPISVCAILTLCLSTQPKYTLKSKAI